MVYSKSYLNRNWQQTEKHYCKSWNFGRRLTRNSVKKSLYDLRVMQITVVSCNGKAHLTVFSELWSLHGNSRKPGTYIVSGWNFWDLFGMEKKKRYFQNKLLYSITFRNMQETSSAFSTDGHIPNMQHYFAFSSPLL